MIKKTVTCTHIEFFQPSVVSYIPVGARPLGGSATCKYNNEHHPWA